MQVTYDVAAAERGEPAKLKLFLQGGTCFLDHLGRRAGQPATDKPKLDIAV